MKFHFPVAVSEDGDGSTPSKWAVEIVPVERGAADSLHRPMMRFILSLDGVPEVHFRSLEAKASLHSKQEHMKHEIKQLSLV